MASAAPFRWPSSGHSPGLSRDIGRGRSSSGRLSCCRNSNLLESARHSRRLSEKRKPVGVVGGPTFSPKTHETRLRGPIPHELGTEHSKMIYSRWGIKEVRLDIAFGKAVWRDQIDPIIAADERRRCCGLGRALARLDLDRERSCLRSHDVRKSETVPAIREMEADLRSRSSHLRASRISMSIYRHAGTKPLTAGYRRACWATCLP